jgi:hypothetical protein
MIDRDFMNQPLIRAVELSPLDKTAEDEAKLDLALSENSVYTSCVDKVDTDRSVGIRVETGECSLKTPEEAVSRIHKIGARRTYEEIAAALNRAGLRSASGRPFTKQHVGYICRRDGLNRRSDTGAP